MDPVGNLFLEGREGGPDLTVRLVKTNDTVAVVPVAIDFLVLPIDGKSSQSIIIYYLPVIASSLNLLCL